MFIRRSFFIIAVLFFFQRGFSQDTYQAKIFLTQSAEDKVPVELIVPSISEDSIEFHMPKIVPGTYSVYDFGRFVNELSATDSLGNKLNIKQLDTNKWRIYDAKDLHKLSYQVDDSFDKSENYKSNFIFEPAGTSIESRRNVFQINTFGFIGYLEGMKDLPFELTVEHPKKIYGATALERKASTDTSDVFIARNYHFLADGPILYCKPDTVSRTIDGAKIMVSVYSPNNILTSEEVMDNIYDLMLAQSKYLGGLPVQQYSYLIYLIDSYTSLSGGMGALEHSYSSVYFLPEANAAQLKKTVRDIAAHEFLHIVTPLNIHSEQIHNFNYIQPEMSKHLWLYEGVTEYSSMHVQVRNGLYTEDVFLAEVRDKILTSLKYADVSFTEMSENILTSEYEEMYNNVYYKGALIGMCLDLNLIKYSGGQMDLPMLMNELSKRYGITQPFEDDNLINIIEEMTFPETGEFFERYVVGSEPLPLSEYLSWAGVAYKEEDISESITMGNFGIQLTDDDELMVSNIEDMNSFGKKLGLKEGDILVSINENDISLENLSEVISTYSSTVEPGDKVIFTVKRENKKKTELVKLKAKAETETRKRSHTLSFIKELTDDQQLVKKVWLNGIDSKN